MTSALLFFDVAVIAVETENSLFSVFKLFPECIYNEETTISK